MPKAKDEEVTNPDAAMPPSVLLSTLRVQIGLLEDSYQRAVETGTVHQDDLDDIITLMESRAAEMEARRS